MLNERPGIRSILVNTIYLAGARVLTVLARVVFVVYLARLMGPEDYGLFNYGISWYLLFLPLCALGMDTVLIREIGRKPRDVERLVSTSYAVRGVASIVAATLCILGGLLLENQAELRLLLLIFSLALVGRGLAQWTAAVLRGKEASHYVLMLEAVFRVAEVVVGIVMLLNGYGLLTLAVVHALAWLAYGIAGVMLIRRRITPGLRLRWDRGSVTRLVATGVPLMVVSLTSEWLRQGPLVLFRHTNGDVQILGQVALAVQVFAIASSVLAEFGAAAIPVLSRSSDRGDTNIGLFVDSAMRIGWLLAGLMMIAAITLGMPLTVRVFGADYALAGALVIWSAAITGAFFWVDALFSTQVARGRIAAVVKAGLLGAGAMAVLYLPLSAILGVHGLFLATLLGLLLCAAVHVWYIAREEPFNWSSAAARPLAAVAAGVAVAWLLLPLGGVWACISGSLVLLFVATAMGVTPVRYWGAAVRQLRFK